MNRALATLVFTALASAQSAQTFQFPESAGAADRNAMETIAVTVAGARVSLDRTRPTMTISGTAESLSAAEWLFHQLEQPAGTGGTATTLHYGKPFGERSEEIAIFIIPAATPTDAVGPLITAIRAAADVQWIFAHPGAKAIAARAAPKAIAEAEWIVKQILPSDGRIPTADSPSYPVDPSNEIRIFRMPPESTNGELTEVWKALQKVEDPGQRVFPLNATKSLIIRSSTENVALAGWLVHELAKPPGNTPHQTTLAHSDDDGVRLFFLASDSASTDVAAIVDNIKALADTQRVFAFSKPFAVLVRGRSAQISTAEGVISNFVPIAH